MSNILQRIKKLLRPAYITVMHVLVEYLHLYRCVPMVESEFTFEVPIVGHCNLNCVSCNHCAPLAEPEFMDLAETTKDFERLSQLFHGKVKRIFLMGGEPLLHPELPGFIRAARDNFPTAEILLVTNGLLLLNQAEEFWDACREKDIIVTPTKYPVPLKFEQMEQCAAKHGVKYTYFGSSGKVTKSMNLVPLDLKGKQDSRKNFLMCYEVGIAHLVAHQVYPCPVAPTSRYLSKYFGVDIGPCAEDSLDIYKVESSREILDFLSRPIPFCRHCMHHKTRWYLPWKQSERKLSEWVYDE